LSCRVSFCPRTLSLTPKQLQCVGLLATGMSQKDAAESLDISSKTIQRWQKMPEFIQGLEASQIIQATPQQTAKVASEVVKGIWNRREELRAKEVSLLDNLQERLMDSIESEGCNYRATNSLIKISERRSKLLGLEIRNLSVLDAIEILLHEQILSPTYAGIVAEGIENIEQNLRIIEAQKQLPTEI
jgi:Bacterial regulatory proteins, luxR family